MKFVSTDNNGLGIEVKVNCTECGEAFSLLEIRKECLCEICKGPDIVDWIDRLKEIYASKDNKEADRVSEISIPPCKDCHNFKPIVNYVLIKNKRTVDGVTICHGDMCNDFSCFFKKN